MIKRIFSGFIAVVGFILSPASFWNDLVVNFPLSYICALPFGLLNRRLFLPMFIVNYWISNILGLVLMHVGVKGMVKKNTKITSKKEIYNMLKFSMLYTVIIVALIVTGIIKFPQEFLDRFIQLTK